MKLIMLFLFCLVSCVLASSATLNKAYGEVGHALKVTKETISRYRKYGGTLVGQLEGLHREVDKLYELQSRHLNSLESADMGRKYDANEKRRKGYSDTYYEMKGLIMAELPALLQYYKSLVRTYNRFVATLDKATIAAEMLEEFKATVLAQMSELKPITSDVITNDYNAFDPKENLVIHKEAIVPTGDQVDKT